MQITNVDQILAGAEEQSKQEADLALLASQSRTKTEEHERQLKLHHQKNVATCNRYLLQNATNILRIVLHHSPRLQKLLATVSRADHNYLSEDDPLFIDLVLPTPAPRPGREDLRGWETPIGGSSQPTTSYHIALQVQKKDRSIKWEEVEVCYCEREDNSNPMYTSWSKELNQFFDDPALSLGLLQLQTEETAVLYLWNKFGHLEKK